MRRPALAAVLVAALPALLAATASDVGHAAPPDDPAGEALRRFEALAEHEGYTIANPVCVETAEEATFVCYAQVDAGGVFAAQSTLDSDVDEWEILERPRDLAPPSDSTSEPDAVEAAGFDPLSFFAALFSADLGQVAKVVASTQPGSPARAYARFHLENLTAAAAAGSDVDRAYVYLGTDQVRVCLAGGACFTIADLDVVGDQLVDFAVDGLAIGPRLGQPSLPVIVGGAAARLLAAYQTVSSDELVAFVEVLSTEAAGFELSTAVYVAADGTQTPVDRDRSPGAVDGTVKGEATVRLVFPGAAPGGVIRILVHPAAGGAPVVAEVPVTPVTES